MPATIWLAGIATVVIGAFVAIRIAQSYVSRVSIDWQVDHLLAAKQYEQAVAALQGQMSDSHDDPHLWFLLGKTHLSAGNLMQAQDAFERSVALDPHQMTEIGSLYLE